MTEQRPGLLMCVCTGKCPGFSKMDIWDFINRARVELPVEFGVVHPQLCEEDGDRFLADFLQAKRPLVIAACAPNMQYKMFRDAFAEKGMDLKRDMTPLDIRDGLMSREATYLVTDELVDTVLAESGPPRDDVAAESSGVQCSCSSPTPGGTLTIQGATVSIPGLPLIFEQCADRNIPADTSGCAALLEAVRIYHRILPEEEAQYRNALLAAYQDFRRRVRPAK
jgi:hypothetical protein